MFGVLLHQLGFMLLGGLFVLAALRHFVNFRTSLVQLQSRGYPLSGLLLAAGSLLELCAGVCLAAGWARPWAAAILIAFTALATVMLVDFWRLTGLQRQQTQAIFALNVAVIGGLLIAATV